MRNEEIFVSLASIILPEYDTDLLNPDVIIEHEYYESDNWLCADLRKRFVNLRNWYVENNHLEEFKTFLKLIFESIYRGKSNLIQRGIDRLFSSRISKNHTDASRRLNKLLENLYNNRNIPEEAKIHSSYFENYGNNSKIIKRYFPGKWENDKVTTSLREKIYLSLKNLLEI
jgi:hypothetical protein